MRRAWAVLVLAMAAPVAAQEAVPAFATCRDIAIERLERELRRHVEGAFAEQVPMADLAGMAFCGEAGIYLCDQKDTADTCHAALTVQQEALRADVLASLPEPEAVAGRRGMWSDVLYARMHALAHGQLYARMHALAHGQSAGPDCAGLAAEEGPRCGARAANRRLDITLRAWVLARYFGAASDAIGAGWASSPPPTRPRAREARE